jgi:hypothetical protein
LGATTGVTTQTAKTAAPVDVKLDGTAANQEALGFAGSPTSKDAFSRANHQHKVSGVLPMANGGTNASSLNCTANQRLTGNGTAVVCETLPGAAGAGTTAPATAQWAGGTNSAIPAAVVGFKVCDQSKAIAATLVASTFTADLGIQSATKTVHVCGFFLLSESAVNLQFVEGAASGCATPTAVTGATPVPAYGGFSMGLSGFAVPFTNTASNYLCVKASGAAVVSGWISYSYQ